jgi:hypothetical protein
MDLSEVNVLILVNLFIWILTEPNYPKYFPLLNKAIKNLNNSVIFLIESFYFDGFKKLKRIIRKDLNSRIC